MEIFVKPCIGYCSAEVFTINGQDANVYDFGDMLDKDPENAPDYGCGDKCFCGNPPEDEVLEKYNITLQEYFEICEELECVLHFGCCAMCS